MPIIDTPTCVHHWFLEQQTSPLVYGRCCKCGAERLFRGSGAFLDVFAEHRRERRSNECGMCGAQVKHANMRRHEARCVVRSAA